VAKSTISSSLTPRISTQLIFTGRKPAPRAASTPSSTWSRASRWVKAKNRSGLSESHEMLIRRNPAWRRSTAIDLRVAPLVVIDSSTGGPPSPPTRSRASVSTSSGK
jgi:hypothetical protein